MRLADCPNCALQLALPDEVTDASRLECPECDAIFSMSEVSPQRIASAKLVPSADDFLSFDAEDSEPAASEMELAQSTETDPSLDFDFDDFTSDPNRLDSKIDDHPSEALEPSESMADVAELEAESEAEFEVEMAAMDGNSLSEGTETTSVVAEEDPLPEFGTVPLEVDRPLKRKTPVIDYGDSSDVPQQVAVGPGMDYGIKGVKPRKKRHRSPFVTIFGLFTSGALGLSLGYVALLWIGGKEKDFLEVGSKLPAWAVPSEFHQPQLADNSSSSGSSSERSERPSLRPTNPTNSDESGSLESQIGTLGNLNDSSTSAPETLPETESRSDLGDLLPSAPNEGTTSQPEVTPPEEETPPMVEPEVEPSIMLKTSGAVSINDLKDAITAARDHQQMLLDGNLGDKAVQRDKGKAFMAFCTLAEKLTDANEIWADQKGSSQEWEPLLQEANTLITETLKTQKAADEVASMGNQWLGWEGRKKPGLLITGSVVSTQTTRTGSTIIVQIPGETKTIAVLVHGATTLVKGDSVEIAGIILDSPSTELLHYAGAAPQVIYSWHTEKRTPENTEPSLFP